MRARESRTEEKKDRLMTGCASEAGSGGNAESLGQQMEESQSMILALAGDYMAVYMIEPAADRAGIVKLDPDITAKYHDIPQSFRYSQRFQSYAETHVYEKDRESFLRAVRPESLQQIFSDGRERFELRYRVLKNETKVHYSGVFVRISKPGEALKLIAGFRNTENIVSIHRLNREKDEKLNEMQEILTTSRMGTWSIHMPDEGIPTMEGDALMLELLGIEDQELSPEEMYDVWYSHIPPASLPSVLRSVEKMEKGGRDENTYLWQHPVLGERYVRCGGTAKPVKDGFVLRGYHYDVDDVVRTQLQHEKREKELEAARLRGEREHAEVVNSLSTIYSTIFRAELDTGRYEVLTSVPLMEEVAPVRGLFRDVKDRILTSFVAPEFREAMSEFLNFDTLAERLQGVNTITMDYKASEEQWIQARIIVKRRDQKGIARELLYVARDITKEKLRDFEQQEALSQALAAAQQASRAKTVFLSSMSHDIRTPMNAIVGFTALARSHIDDTVRVHDYLQKISTSSAHLLNLINDILDMSRIESGTVKLEESSVHIPTLLQELRTMLQSLVYAKSQKLLIDTRKLLHTDVFTDRLRLNQVLLNIVGNAIKFTQPGGEICICLSETPSVRPGYSSYVFSVKDNGIGMSEEYLKHIFETFSRERSSTASGIQGTGLGMAITKNIVDMMGGDIQVESKEGKGSLFTVTLQLRIDEDAVPTAADTVNAGTECAADGGYDRVSRQSAPEKTGRSADTAGQEALAPQRYDYSGRRVLLAEDNEVNREIAAAILEETGMTVDSVNDGAAAVSAIEQAPADRYDLIFMDIQMPRMDGYTATKEIRRLSDPQKAAVPIVAMTANAFEEDRKKSYEAGMNGHIIKPINIEEIAKVLNRIFQGGAL